jgi:hypothetical protein
MHWCSSAANSGKNCWEVLFWGHSYPCKIHFSFILHFISPISPLLHHLDLLFLHLETDHFQWIWIGRYHVGSPSGKCKLLPGGNGMQVGTSKVLWMISFYSNCSNWLLKQNLIFAFLCGMISNNSNMLGKHCMNWLKLRLPCLPTSQMLQNHD